MMILMIIVIMIIMMINLLMISVGDDNDAKYLCVLTMKFTDDTGIYHKDDNSYITLPLVPLT